MLCLFLLGVEQEAEEEVEEDDDEDGPEIVVLDECMHFRFISSLKAVQCGEKKNQFCAGAYN